MIKPRIAPEQCPRRNSEGRRHGIDHDLLPRVKVPIDVLPDDADPAGDLEESAEPTLVDERIPVRQTLRVGNPRAEEIRDARLLIFPHDRFRRRIDFEYAREWERMVQSVRPVIEQQQVSVGQNVRRVLARKRRRAELPVDGAGSAVDHHDGGDIAETHKQVSVGHLRDPISDGPHVAIILDGRDHVFLGIQVLPAQPFPYELSVGRHLDEVGRIHLSIVVLRARPATSHLESDVGRKRFLADQKDVSISQADAIVVVIGMVHLP